MAAKDQSQSLKNNHAKRGGKGGARPGAGRKPNVPNKATASLRELARQYTEEALKSLVLVMKTGESEAARVSAANAILDRGYGKPSTVLNGDEDGGAVKVIAEVVFRGLNDAR